ncbi:MAG: CDP-glycerol glycerophosphotransferase family protein [Nitrospirae bacterium]|nr:CDP-glycerol glycerophosphotransferase family protein [Nitrospirota bacterium]
MKKEKVIFIILEFGTAIRNVLRTDIFKILKAQKDIKIVIFSPIVDESFRREFESENVIVEPNPKHRDFLTRGIESIKKYVWAKGTGVATLKIKRKHKPIVKPRYALMGKILMGIVGDHFKLLNILNRLQVFFFKDSKADYYFDKYKPDLVFYTTMYAKDPCIEIEAKKRNIKTINLIHSWDNLTIKGPFAAVPDKTVVWNEILKEELIKYHNFPENDIYISGIPQFDIYFNKNEFSTKEEFFKKWGLDKDKKLLTYASAVPGIAPYNQDIVEILYDALKNEQFNYPCQIVVRLHPKDNYELFKKFEGLDDIVIQKPGRPADVRDKWNPTHEDMKTLAELMCYSDVVVNIASTITIDAVAFDTPVVCIGFDGYQQRPYSRSCKRYYDYDHFKNIVNSGGVRISYSKEDLIKHINVYLAEPSLDIEGREKIRKGQCWKLDGNAGKRTAEFTLQYLEE